MPPTSKPEEQARTWPLLTSRRAAIAEGLSQLEQGECFAAHETLEAVWIEASGAEKRLIQGLIQLAVAWHHWQQGNCKGAQGVLARAYSHLSALQASPGLPLENPQALIDTLAQAKAWLEAGQPAPPPPKIQLR